MPPHHRPWQKSQQLPHQRFDNLHIDYDTKTYGVRDREAIENRTTTATNGSTWPWQYLPKLDILKCHVTEELKETCPGPRSQHHPDPIWTCDAGIYQGDDTAYQWRNWRHDTKRLSNSMLVVECGSLIRLTCRTIQDGGNISFISTNYGPAIPKKSQTYPNLYSWILTGVSACWLKKLDFWLKKVTLWNSN